MAGYITRIRTESGDLQIDYDALANLPQSDSTLTIAGGFADAKAVGDKLKKIDQITNSSVPNSTTINGKPLNSNITLGASDVQAAPAEHEHDMAHITSGILGMDQGGTNASTGADGLKNLFADGPTVLSSHQYGDALPSGGAKGQVFFVKIQQGA
jgi:hypothetical protein